MATRDPLAPEELQIGTDLNLRKNKPFRIVDRWSAREHIAFFVIGVVSILVLAYFFWPKR